MNEVRLRKTTGGDDEDNEQTKANIDYPEIDTSDEEVKPNQDKPATGCDSCCDMSTVPKKIVLAASVIILFFFWWNQPSVFDPSDIFESNISDKELACTERFAKRAARVEKVCKKLTEDGSPFKDILLSSPVNIDGNVYISRRRSAMVCIPHKTGSQTWRYFFLKLNEKDDPENPSGYMFPQNTTSEAYRHFEHRVVQTRHPLERLLSGYKFTFLRDSNKSTLRGLILDIFHRFPNTPEETNYSEKDIWNHTPDFGQFVNYITTVPNFGNVDEYPMGNHWMPQYHFCNPCHQMPDNLPHKVINLEDFHKDAQCFLETLTPELEEDDYARMYNVNQGPSGHSSNEDLKVTYYGQLTKAQMDRVYQFFMPDYLLFGYEKDTFYNYAKDA